MKILVRILGLALISLSCLLTVMVSVEDNVYLDQLERCSSLAMANTQYVISEYIEDKYLGLNNGRYYLDIENDEDYLNFYLENLNKLLSGGGSITVDKYYADLNRGLLYVKLAYHFRSILGEEKILYKEMLNIVDVVIDEDI